MPFRLAIIGAGNPGSWLAVHLSNAGLSVHLCVRRDPGPLLVHGLSPGTLPHYLDSGPPADFALLTTKTYDNPAALARVNAFILAAIQNGLGQPGIPVLSYVYVKSQNGVCHAFPPPRPHFTIPLGTTLPALFRDTPIQLLEDPISSPPLGSSSVAASKYSANPCTAIGPARFLAESLPLAAAAPLERFLKPGRRSPPQRRGCR